MTLELACWFSNLCPEFSVFDAQIFTRRCESELESSEEGTLSAAALKTHGFEKAARWLERNGALWHERVASVPDYKKAAFEKKFQIIFWGDALYPKRLRHLHFPPAVLFVRGNITCLEKQTVSMVGARHPTELGRLWIETIMPKLASSDLTIVSGGARGIDSDAHEAAMRNNIATVAFLPGSVVNPYPNSNEFMFKRILEKGGALISEFVPGTSVRSENFFKRNRLIAGVAQVVVIVEAARKSGTIMTAHKALAENRDVLIVPGPPLVASYVGSLDLLGEGAGLARDAEDIIFCLKLKN